MSDANKLLREALEARDVISTIAILRTEDINPNIRDVYHDLQTLIMRVNHLDATEEQTSEMVRLLLNKNPNIDCQDASGLTALSHACIAEQSRVIQMLCQYKTCDPNLPDKYGNTSVMYACKTGRKNVIKTLIKSCKDCGVNIDFHYANNLGVTPMMEAMKKDLNETISQFSVNNKDLSLSRLQSPRVLMPVFSPCGSPQISGRGNRRNIGPPLSNMGELQTSNVQSELCNNWNSRRHGNRSYGVELYDNSSDTGSDTDDDEIFDEISEDSDLDAERETEENRLKYKASRRGSVSLPDLRNVSGFLVAQSSPLPNIVIQSGTPTNILKSKYDYKEEYVANVSGFVKQRKDYLKLPELSNSLPDLGLSKTIIPRHASGSIQNINQINKQTTPRLLRRDQVRTKQLRNT